MGTKKNLDVLTKTEHLPQVMVKAVQNYGSPLYIYDETTLIHNCKHLLNMPSAYGLTVRYAMKANSNKSLLNVIQQQGLHFDMSSINEVRRAKRDGIRYEKMLLTSQDIPADQDFEELKIMINSGLEYTVCSANQLKKIIPVINQTDKHVSIRIHPGKGSGISATRNTGDPYASFGVLQSDLPVVKKLAQENKINFNRVHVHIGSGSDPKVWVKNIGFFPNGTLIV